MSSTLHAAAENLAALDSLGHQHGLLNLLRDRSLLSLRQDLTLVDPNLHADTAIGGLGFSEAVVDVGAQGLQRDGAIMIVLGAGNVRGRPDDQKRWS